MRNIVNFQPNKKKCEKIAVKDLDKENQDFVDSNVGVNISTDNTKLKRTVV